MLDISTLLKLEPEEEEDPVKNVTWVLMEIPCRLKSQIDGSLVKIDTKFHDYSISLFQVLFVFHAQT